MRQEFFDTARALYSAFAMASSPPERIAISAQGAPPVSALLRRPSRARACFVFAPGAGAGIQHSFINEVATALAARDVATLCYQFPYMERGLKRPDPPELCHATVRAAVASAAQLIVGVPLVAGGKSFGGRMTSQAQALSALRGVRGLVFLGFPLHAPQVPSDTRARHLFEVQLPMLFLQGTRDDFADLTLLQPIVERLGARATLKRLEHADHSFHVLKRSGRDDSEIRRELVQLLHEWIQVVIEDH